jgi:hypothetical protein
VICATVLSWYKAGEVTASTLFVTVARAFRRVMCFLDDKVGVAGAEYLSWHKATPCACSGTACQNIIGFTGWETDWVKGCRQCDIQLRRVRDC